VLHCLPFARECDSDDTKCHLNLQKGYTMSYTLYGAEVSYFTGKIRAYLRWKDIAFEEQVATKDVYKDVILPRVGWPVIPVIVGPDDETLQDTSDMIDALEAKYDGPSVYPDGPAQKLAALLLEVIGDQWMVMPAMHYRWKHNRDFAYAEFGALSAPDASPEEQFEIGRKNAVNFEGALPVLGIDDVTGPAIEEAYLSLLKHMDAHFEAHDYLLGSRPSIGDYGMVGPLYAHQYRDPASGEIMKREAPRVAAWCERMQHPPAPLSGEFLAADAVPETVMPILSEQMRDFMPVLTDTAATLTAWADSKAAGEAVPRALGQHAFEVNGAAGKRMIFPFNLWMLQRALDHYQSLSGADKAAADALLKRAGCAGLSDFPAFPRVERKAFKLVLG